MRSWKESSIKAVAKFLEKNVGNVDIEIAMTEMHFYDEVNVINVQCFDGDCNYIFEMVVSVDDCNIMINTRKNVSYEKSFKTLVELKKVAIDMLYAMFDEYDYSLRLPENNETETTETETTETETTETETTETETTETETTKPTEKFDNLEHEIKCKNDVDENDRFCDSGFELEITNSNSVKVVNLEVFLTKEKGKYFISGSYGGGAKFKTLAPNLEKALRKTIEYALRVTN